MTQIKKEIVSPVRRANPWPLHQSAHCGQNPLLLIFFLTFEPTFMISCCLHRAENGASSLAICCRYGRSTSRRGPAQPPSAKCSPADTCDATPEGILRRLRHGSSQSDTSGHVTQGGYMRGLWGRGELMVFWLRREQVQ